LVSYDQAIIFKSDDYGIWNNRGLALADLDQHIDAITDYERALTINPKSHLTYFNIGNALFRLSYDDEAIDSYDKAIAIEPNYHKAWNARGAVLQKQGYLSEAAESFARALAIQPNDLLVLRNNVELALRLQDEARITELKEIIVSNSSHMSVSSTSISEFQELISITKKICGLTS